MSALSFGNLTLSKVNGAEAIQCVDVSKEGWSAEEDLTQFQALARFHVRINGRLVSGAEAFVSVWEVLPRWQGLALLARIRGVPSLLEVAYRLFLPVCPYLSFLLRRISKEILRDLYKESACPHDTPVTK